MTIGHQQALANLFFLIPLICDNMITPELSNGQDNYGDHDCEDDPCKDTINEFGVSH